MDAATRNPLLMLSLCGLFLLRNAQRAFDSLLLNDPPRTCGTAFSGWPCRPKATCSLYDSSRYVIASARCEAISSLKQGIASTEEHRLAMTLFSKKIFPPYGGGLTLYSNDE